MVSGSNPESRVTSDGWIKRDPAVCPTSRQIVFSTNRSAGWSIWRIEQDGRGAAPLTNGHCCDLRPQCSPDGSTVIFQSDRSGRLSAWSVPTRGGSLRQLTDRVCLAPAWSADGSKFACHDTDPSAPAKWGIAIYPAAGGNSLSFVSSIGRNADFRWDRAGDALLYVDTADGVGNVWRRPLNGAPAQKLTSFTNDRIFSFAQGASGDLAFVRGYPRQNAVRISLAMNGE
jgi:Tol biopolymer transport system component